MTDLERAREIVAGITERASPVFARYIRQGDGDDQRVEVALAAIKAEREAVVKWLRESFANDEYDPPSAMVDEIEKGAHHV